MPVLFKGNCNSLLNRQHSLGSKIVVFTSPQSKGKTKASGHWALWWYQAKIEYVSGNLEWLKGLLPACNHEYRIPGKQTSHKRGTYQGWGKKAKTVRVFQQALDTSLPNIPKKSWKVADFEDKPDERGKRIISGQAVAIKPEQMHTHCPQPLIHQVAYWIAIEITLEILTPHQ